MARLDDYLESFRLAGENLKKANIHRLAKLAGAEVSLAEEGDVEVRFPFMGEDFIVMVGDQVDVVDAEGKREVSLPEKILLCHYLLHATGARETGNAITFREIPDGHFYYDAFQKRARDPFLAAFGHDPELFRRCGEEIGGRPIDIGDVGMAFEVFPRITVRIALWRGDDELSPEASILFDDNVQSSLPVEDIAVMSGMLVYRLMGLARSHRMKAEKE